MLVSTCGMNTSKMLFPNASSFLILMSFSACLFQYTIVPSRSVMMIASLVWSRIESWSKSLMLRGEPSVVIPSPEPLSGGPLFGVFL